MGQPTVTHTTVVCCDFDGEYLPVTTMAGFVKDWNLTRNTQVTALCFDPGQPLRYLEVRGPDVGMTESGARQHLDRVASKYAGRPFSFDCWNRGTVDVPGRI
jgi:hypothetical protein